MPYDLSDPNFNFAGQEDILIRALREAAKQKATPFNEGVGTGRSFRASGADPGAFLSRAAGQINQQRAEQERMALGSEQQRRYGDLSRQLNTPGEVDYADPNSMVADNARRMELAGQMGDLNLPQAQKMAQAYLTKGVNFPESMAKMQSDRIERGEQNAMRLQEVQAQKERDAANQLIRDRERAQDRQDNIRLAASLRASGGGNKSDMRIVDTVDAEGNPVKQVIDLSQMKPGDTLNKPADAATKKAIIEGRIGAAGIDRAIELIDARPSSLGVQYKVPGAEVAGQYLDPEGVPVRAAVANVGSLKLHDRSGAAVTVSEFPRLAPFIPTAGDSPAAAKKKLEGLKSEYEVIQKEWKGGINGSLLGGSPKPAAKSEGAGPTVVRTGTRNGKRVQQMSDGSIREVD